MCICLTISSLHSADRIVFQNSLLPSIGGESIGQYDMQVEDTEIITPLRVTEAKRIFRINNLVIMSGIIIIGSFLTYYLAGRALKPLEVFANTVSERTAETLAEQIELPKIKDEVYELTKAFNKMSSEVSNAYVEQKNFSANAAHELRTPLAVLQTKLEVFNMKDNRTKDEYLKLIHTVEINVERISSIVQGLFDLSNCNHIDMNQKVALLDIIEEIVFELEDMAEKHGIALNVTGEKCILTGNDSLLQRTIHNLIVNAIKYNVDGGSVSVNVKKVDNKVKVLISDTGIGIPDNCKANLFEPFYRVDESRCRDIAGSGLGLALVRNIINKHNGSITVKDNNPKGTCFEMELPC